ncbi:MAG: dethiobiotin synthase [Campylobacterota bacterium]|nr:dethiobiotin synthase [Campylobacterota bacterium]
MHRIFITATNTDIGKTYTTTKLIEHFSNLGYKVGVIKPIESGVQEYPLDGKLLFETALKYNSKLSSLTINDIVPIQLKLPAAPYVANSAKKIDLHVIDEAVKKVEKLCDILLIEGAGGLYVPLDKELMIIDLIEHFRAKTLLVSHCNLGSINDTILSQLALQQRGLSFVTTLNCFENELSSFNEISYPYFKNMENPPLLLHSNIDEVASFLLN